MDNCASLSTQFIISLNFKHRLLLNSTALSSSLERMASSNLPSWVYTMRARIEESRASHAEAESALDSLKVNTSLLTAQLNDLQILKQQQAEAKAKTSATANSVKGVASSTSTSTSTSSNSRRQHLALLQGDVLNIIFDFLFVGQLSLSCYNSFSLLMQNAAKVFLLRSTVICAVCSSCNRLRSAIS